MLALRTAFLLGVIAFAVLLMQGMPLKLALYRSAIVTLGSLFLIMLTILFLRVVRGKRPVNEESKNEQEQEETGSEGQKQPANKQGAIDHDDAAGEQNKTEGAAV